VFAAIAAVGCTGGDGEGDVAPSTSLENTTTTTIERSGDGALKLGVYLPRTGEGAQLGEPMIEAVETAVEVINAAGGVLGEQIEVQIVDEGGGTGPDELLVGGVDAIVGPASSHIALAQLANVVQLTTGVVTCSPTATALSLDDFPDNGFFFRTAPSDSLQMAAIARRVEDTGETSVAVGYLDDPYGRGLVGSFVEEADRLGLDLSAEVGFGGDQEDLSEVVTQLLAESPGVIVALGDADDGSRLLSAIDAAVSTGLRRVIVNDAIRDARQTIQTLTPGFRQRVVGVAPNARSLTESGPEGFFTAHAVDCVNLIALATIVAGSDSPNRIKAKMGEVASGGRVCTSFEGCVTLLDQDLQIDYNGASGSVDLSNSAGDPVRAWFESFSFDADGLETGSLLFEVR
jgi:branched-chain amino acid transport system substrate-binding protein